MGEQTRWAVVGGGFLGMTLALRLAQRGHEITLFEAAPELGGLAGSWSIGDVVWDRHYHVTLLSDRHLRKLLAELGLDEHIRWVETKTACYADGELYSVSNVGEFLRFPPLRMVDKLRLGLTIYYGSKIRNGRRLEQVLVADWLRRWSGRRAFEGFWLPLLRSKLGENYRVTSAAFIWATIRRLYAARRSGLKRELFGYVPGGYARVLDRLGEVLLDAGVKVELGARVETVSATDDGVGVTLGGGATSVFDRVVVTTNTGLAARIIEGLDQDERARLQGIRYQGIVCASVLTTQSLSGYYVTSITDEAPFTAVIEMTALVDRETFDGRSLIYLPRYVDPDDPIFEEEDPAIQDRFLAGLGRLYPNFDPDAIEAFRVSRVRQVLAIPTLGYSDRLPPTATSVPGIHVVSSAHIINGTLNVDETVALAEEAVSYLIGAGS